MAEQGVTIPIFMEVQEDNDIYTYLQKLKKSIESVQTSNEKSSKVGPIDVRRIETASRKLDDYINKAEKMQESGEVTAEAWNDIVEGSRRELEIIDQIVARYPQLKEMMLSLSEGAGTQNWKDITNARELTQYVDALNRKLQEVKDYLKDNPSKGNNVLENTRTRIEDNIKALDEYIKKIGEVTKELSEAEAKAANATNFSTKAKKASQAGEEWATSHVVGQAKIDAKSARDYYAQLEVSSAKATRQLKEDIHERMADILEEQKYYQEAIQHVGKDGVYRQKVAKGLSTSDVDIVKANAAVDAEKEAKKATEAQIKALNEEAAAVKQSVSQYYYKLRAVKMLHFAINNIDTALGKFGKTTLNVATKSLSAYLRLIPGVSRLQKSLSQSSTSQKKFNLGLRNTTKEADKLNFSVKDTIKNLLKYGLGIRSLFVLFNRLRSAVISGFNDMAKIYDPVNKQLSSISASLMQLRNAASAAVEPLLSVLAPALERIAALASEVAYKVASFIAALTGRSMVIRATRAQTDYAKSLDKTGKSAKKARGELAAFDDLDVLNKQDDGGGDGGVGAMFDEVPIDETMKDWAEKFKEFLDKLLGPIMKAWDRARAYVTNAFKYMCQQIKALWADVARDFWRVWEEFTTEQMFYFLFLALGDIMLAIGSIAKQLREAWNYAENGYRIFKAIRDMAYDVAVHLRHMTAATRDWAESVLNFKPLFTALADALEKKVEPAFNRVLGLIEMLYNNAVLDLLRDFINTNLPVIVTGIGEIAKGIGLIARRIQTALETGKKVDKQLVYTRSRLQQILDKVEHFSHLVSETFAQLGEDFSNWADSLDFRPLFDSIIELLNGIQPMFEALFGHFEVVNGHLEHIGGIINKLWKDTILPFWKYLIEDGGPKLIELLGKIFGEYDEDTGLGIDWERLTQNINTFIDALEPFFELAWETLLQIIEDLGRALDDFINSGTLEAIVNGFKNWVENANPEDLAHKIETFAVVFTGLKGAFSAVNHVLLPFLESWMSFRNFLNNTHMVKQLADIKGNIEALKNPTTEVATAMGSLTTESGKVVGSFEGLPALFGETALKLGLIAGAVADIFLAIELDKLKKIDEQINALPQTASDLNGLNIEMDKFQKLLKFIYELWTGETILDHFVVQSDYEKLETMTQKLNTMGQEMENNGTLSEEMSQKIDDAFAILGDNIDSVENLTDEQVQAFSELYGEVENYYNVVEDKVPKIQILWETFLDIFRDPEGILDNFVTALNNAGEETVKLKDIIGSFPEVMHGTFDFWKERLGYVKYETEETKTATEELGNAATTAASTAATAADTTKAKAEEVKHPIRDIINNIFGAKSATEELTETTETGSYTMQTTYSDLSTIVGETGILIRETTDNANTAMSTSQQNASTYKDATVTALDNIQTKFGEVALDFTSFTESIQLTLETVTTVIDTWYTEIITTYFGYEAWLTVLQEGMLTAFNDFFSTVFLPAWDSQMQSWWTTHVLIWFANTWWQSQIYTPMFTFLKEKWKNLITWWDTVTKDWFRDLSTVKWVNLMKWWDTSIKDWWDNRVVPWFKESLWEPQFMHIYNVAKRIFELIRDVIHDKMDEAKEFCIECCDAMAESISHVISLVDELIDKLRQLESMSGSVNVSISGNIPHLAQGAVIPPNKEFMAVLGDQTSGTNIETPLSTMLDAFRSVMEEYGGARGPQNAIMEVDGETFARLMMPHVMDEMHRLGYNTEIIEGM